ncbi:MAG: SDR family NAD(P)-dependent oxidoreductase [Streptosporangiaceae bacterium]
MTITLITGGNKGLGREAARRLIGLGHTVYLGARDAGRGQAAADELGARFLPLDVTGDCSVAAAADTLTRREGRLDVLINNAGVFEGLLKPEEITASDPERSYAVNVIGIVRMTQAFLPLLRASTAPVIVNVSSGLGSFGVVTDPASGESGYCAPVYGSSKAAVGMLTVQYARGLPDLRINAADPGFTATDLNGGTGHQTVEEGTDAIVRLATIGPDGPTGTFCGRAGPVPW